MMTSPTAIRSAATGAGALAVVVFGVLVTCVSLEPRG